jgi:serine phosphatase RsbU (regulator of sigma subunit)
MEVQIGVAKINKYATSESGDTLEVVERPEGGLSVVLADGQRSGKSAKRISNMVVRKVISLLAEGVRDGAAARAASDYLFSERGGKVQSTLNILSVDMHSRTLVISRNNEIPAIVVCNGEMRVLDEASVSVGIYRNTRPVITEVSLEEGLVAIVFSDGLRHAGDRKGQRLDIPECVQTILNENPSAQIFADRLMELAMTADEGRPIDDVSIVVLRVMPYNGVEIRRMQVRLPITRYV